MTTRRCYCCASGTNSDRHDQSIRSPNGFMVFNKTVFGNSPLPHSLKEPESLCQSPSGANGCDLTQTSNSCRSRKGTWRSSTRSRMCCQTARGRLENRILGNRLVSEDGSNQVTSGLVLLRRISFFEKSLIGSFQALLFVLFGANAAFGKGDQRAANCQLAFFGHAAHCRRQGRGNRDALPNRSRCLSGCGSMVYRHNSIVPTAAPVWFKPPSAHPPETESATPYSLFAAHTRHAKR